MATVYLAQDARHERLVALKVLHPDFAASLGAERFLREIKLAARLNHPHILPLFDSGEAGGTLYYVMPYIEGESLRERLDREQQLPVEEAVHIASALAAALDYAHRQQIVHRDIKPENIMLYEGEPMIMDFGIAKALSYVGNDTLTQSGFVVGTPAYVSPEQAAGNAELDGRSDQYSLACVLYEMLAGQRPFIAPSAQAVLAMRFTTKPRPVSELRGNLSPRIERALDTAMNTDPTERFPTAALFAQALRTGSENGPAMPVPSVSMAKSVAVLPFTNMSADAENEYFTEGMAEEIINALTKIQSLRVASRTSSFAFKGKTEDIRDIGRKLRVSTVLEGSVRKMGNKLRISAQLINVADGYHLWSEKYDRQLEDVFAIQDDISQAIVKSLRVILSEAEQKAMEKSRAVNVEAYDLYLRGRQYFHKFGSKAFEYAREMFARAVRIDPEYAMAWAGIAYSHAMLGTYFDARELQMREADFASRKALELDPDLAEAHVARGLALVMSKRHAEADDEFETAMRLDPKLFEAPYFFGRSRRDQGQFEEAAKLLARASLLRPEDFESPFFLGDVYAALGQQAEAVAALHRTVKLIEQRVALNPDDARAWNLGASALSKLGEHDRARKYLARSLAIDPDDPIVLYNAACTYATLGDSDDALTALERCVANGWNGREILKHDHDLDPIRGTLRFLVLSDSMGRRARA
jgi:serine/threonine protein kinase/Flp pilus assembly protein TadD